MSEEPEEPKQTAEHVPVKKSRWLRRIVWFILLLTLIILLLGYLINGVGARWFIKKQLGKIAEQQGMEGTADITGSLLTGFSIENADYTGKLGIQKLQIKKASISYDLRRIKNKQIDLIELHNATIEFDITQFQSSKAAEGSIKQDDEPNPNIAANLKSLMYQIRPWVTNPEINIHNFDLTIIKEEQPFLSLQLGSLSHTAKSPDFQLTSLAVQDKQGRTTPLQDILISCSENNASIDKLEPLPGIAIKNGRIDWENDLTGTLGIQLHDSDIDLHISEQIHLSLKSGNINSSELEKSFGINLPADFVIHLLESSITHWQKPIPLWEVNTELGVQNAVYKNYEFTESSLTFNQSDTNYSLKLNSNIKDCPISAKIEGQWLKPTVKKWWSENRANFQIEPIILGNTPELWEHDHSKINLTTTELTAAGNIEFKNNQLIKAEFNADISGATTKGEKIPAIQIKSGYSDQKPHLSISTTANQIESRTLLLQANYDIDAKTYDGNLLLKDKAPQWINALCLAFDTNIDLENEIDITWSGNGKLHGTPSHSGDFSIQKLFLKLPEAPTLDIDSIGRYSWPTSINVDALNIRESNWNATTSVIWDGQTIIIPAIILKESTEAVLGGSIMSPLTLENMNIKDFFAQKAPWNITLKTQPLSFEKFSEWFKFALPNDIKGTTDVYIELSGSPAEPQASGSANLTKVTGLTNRLSRPVSAHFNFTSTGNKLEIDSELNEGETERLAIQGLFPFLPNKWINEPGSFSKSVKSSPVNGNLKLKAFPLSELKQFVPQLEKIEGNVSGSGEFSGSWNDPIYILDIQATAPVIQLSEKSIGTIKDVKLNTSITHALIIQNKLEAQINGGKFEIEGTVDINDLANPIFDINLNTQHAMVYRDDLLSTRANGALNLQGTINDALITGQIGIVESLIYKDIELIPIGVPSSEVAKVELPSINTSKIDNGLAIPAPFSDWKLDVTLLTQDPVLIRGNIAQGSLDGSIKVDGTLAFPEPDGTIYINKTKARLPFSILSVDKGEISFTPKEGIIPHLKILGKSSIGSHDVNLLIHGSASSPNTGLTSSPPLPESEIMSLLATGTTTEKLANGDVAVFKAFQLLLIKMQQRQDPFGGNKLSRILLSGIENFNLNVGEKDQFTDREYASATLALNKDWHLTAQVDDSQQTRGLIVYVIRFR